MEYSVQKILDKMIDPGTSTYQLIREKQLYLIKWQGYDISYASWEPYQHVKDNCQSLLAQFEAKFGNVVTTAIGKIYIPHTSKKRNDLNTPKLSRTLKIKKQNKISLVKLKTTSQISENRFKLHNGQSSSKRLQSCAKGIKFYSNLKEPKNIGMFQHEKQLLSNFRPITRRNNLNLIQTNSITSDRNNSIKDKQLNQMRRRINNQEQQISNQYNGHENQRVKREIKRFTPIIIQNAPLKSSRKISMHQQRKNQEYRQKQRGKDQKKQYEQAIDIIGMRKSQEGFQFYVSKNGKNFWTQHSQVFNNYSKELCKFYERNLILQ